MYRYAYHMPQNCYIYMFAVNPASLTIWYIVDGYITCLHVCAVLLKVNESSATTGSQGELLSRRCVTLLKAALRSDVWPNSELKLNWSVWRRVTRHISNMNRACWQLSRNAIVNWNFLKYWNSKMLSLILSSMPYCDFCHVLFCFFTLWKKVSGTVWLGLNFCTLQEKPL